MIRSTLLLRRPTPAFKPHLNPPLRSTRLVHRQVLKPSGLPLSRSKKWCKRATYLTAGIGSIYGLDKTLNASALTRNLRTLWTCAVVAADYKLNFTPEKSDEIPELHERVGQRIYDLLTSNGGLYIKLGQAIGANAALLPPAIQNKFAQLFDNAPQIPLSQVHSVFRSEFNGRLPSDVFEVFDETPVASASIAQVHKARLKGNDPVTGEERWVAVKIQKPDVAKQMEWDLGAYRAVMWMFENWLFDLPVYFTVDFLSDHLRKELDFVQEASNAKMTAAFVASEPSLADKVHIPKIYDEFSTMRIMTAEWIDGIRFSDRAGIFKLMGEEDPRSGALGSVPIQPDVERNVSQISSVPLKGGVKSIMQAMVSLFSAQIFSWGYIHCDPHPGNIIIRPNPSHPTQPQLVLIDHGLYVRVSEEFRHDYAELWRGMLGADFQAVENVVRKWGFGNPDLFASATLMRPIKLKNRRQDRPKEKANEEKEESHYERSVRMKRHLKNFLMDTDRMPKELMFLGRNMRMVQGNNQSMGSPVNRIKITGYWATRSLTQYPASHSSSLFSIKSFRNYLRFCIGNIFFKTAMLSLDIAFWATRVRQWFSTEFGALPFISTWRRMGFEDELEEKMRAFAKKSFGVDVQPGYFQG